LRSLALWGLFLSFLLAPFHPLSHKALKPLAYLNDITVGSGDADWNHLPSRQTCPTCQSLQQQRHASPALVGSGLKLLSGYGTVEDAPLDLKTVEPLGWHLTRAPPRSIEDFRF